MKVKIINIFGYFSGTFEISDRFETIPITVVESKKKNRGLRGKDALEVQTSNIINIVKSKKVKMGALKRYKAKHTTK